jgi:hypothetical protein
MMCEWSQYFPYNRVTQTQWECNVVSQNTPTIYDYGVQRIWIDAGRIAIIRTDGSVTPGALRMWARVVTDTAWQFPVDRPIAICHDLGKRQSFNADVRHYAQKVYTAMPQDRPIYGVVTLPNNLLMPIIGLFVRRHTNKRPNVYEHVTADIKKSIAWLREQIQQHDQASV